MFFSIHYNHGHFPILYQQVSLTEITEKTFTTCSCCYSTCWESVIALYGRILVQVVAFTQCHLLYNCKNTLVSDLFLSLYFISEDFSTVALYSFTSDLHMCHYISRCSYI